MRLCKGFVVGMILIACMGISFGKPVCERASWSKSAEDLVNVKELCATAMPAALDSLVDRVEAYGLQLYIHVKSKELAYKMRLDPLSTKRLVLSWMGHWKRINDSPVVTVTIEWDGVKIATGDTSVFSGDQVEIH